MVAKTVDIINLNIAGELIAEAAVKDLRSWRRKSASMAAQRLAAS